MLDGFRLCLKSLSIALPKIVNTIFFVDFPDWFCDVDLRLDNDLPDFDLTFWSNLNSWTTSMFKTLFSSSRDSWLDFQNFTR